MKKLFVVLALVLIAATLSAADIGIVTRYGAGITSHSEEWSTGPVTTTEKFTGFSMLMGVDGYLGTGGHVDKGFNYGWMVDSVLTFGSVKTIVDNGYSTDEESEGNIGPSLFVGPVFRYQLNNGLAFKLGLGFEGVGHTYFRNCNTFGITYGLEYKLEDFYLTFMIKNAIECYTLTSFGVAVAL